MRVKSVHFREPIAIAGNMHSTITSRSPTQTHLEMILEDGWLKIKDPHRHEERWVERGVIRSIVPTDPPPPPAAIPIGHGKKK